MKKVVVTDYQPEWAEQFKAFKAVFQKHLKDIVLSIEHVGSTAVPGLAAKPILDMDIIVADVQQLAEVIRRLEKLGYRHVGDQGVPGREVVKPVSDLVPIDGSGRQWPRHHLYICKEGVPSLQNHLNLRNYLRSHPQKAAAYGALKKQLAAQFPHDIDAYIDGKTTFILEILAETGITSEDLAVARAINLKSVSRKSDSHKSRSN